MTGLFQVLAALVVSASAQDLGVFKTIGRSVNKEIAAVKQPVDETLVFIGNSQCANVKKLIGVQYEQLKGANEPDLNQLTLNFFSKAFNVTYNLSYAAELIPKTRGYDPNQNLIIFIHGFTDDPTKASFANISTAFLNEGEYNILALDGSSLISGFYLRSTTYVRFMGEKLGQTLAAMVATGMSPKSIHLIGHSLGAHIAGFTGKTFANLTGSLVGRISGLDPAGPCFAEIDVDLRLKATDAEFVDVIHTDSGVYGLREAIGHADYYPNGGSQQPNCLFQTCSHSRAWLLFAESVARADAFLSVSCASWDGFREGQCGNTTVVMGYSALPDTRGSFFLRTGEDLPYGLGSEGVKYVNNEGIIRNIGNVLFKG